MISNKPNKQTKVTKHKSKKVPSKKSWVWNWFAEVNLPNGKKVSECQVLVTAEKACKKCYATDGSTGNLITHLYSKHQIVETTKKSDLMVTIKNGTATRKLQLRRLQPGLQPVAEP